MSGPPAGWRAAWSDNPHQLRVAARVLPADGGDPLELPLVSGTVTHDAGTGWRTQATMAAPYSDQLWEAVRGWAAPRVQVDCELVAPTGAATAVRLLDAGVRWAGVARPAQLVELRAASDAALVSDQPLTEPWAAAPGADGADQLRALITAALPGALFTQTATAPLGGTVEGQPAQDRWQLVEQVADAAGLQVHQRQADRRWVIEQQPRMPGGQAVDTLATGLAGNVASSGSEYDRDALANGYAVHATWVEAGGAARTATGFAYDTDPASPTRWGGPAGRRMQVDTQPGPLDAAACQALAAQRLYRRLGAGRGAQLVVPLRPWLMPGDPVKVSLPYAGALQLVQVVTHDLAALTTAVATRQPATGLITPTPA